MKKIQLFVTLLALSVGALAQDNPSTPPADPAKLALAREVVAAMHADKMFEGMTVQMKQMANQMAAGALPAQTTPEQREKFEAFQNQVMELSINSAKGLVARMDQIYADVFSEAELKAIKAFYLSPEGQSMLAKQPHVMQHLMPYIQQMQRDLMPKIRQLAQEMKAEAPSPASDAAPAPPQAAAPTAAPAN